MTSFRTGTLAVPGAALYHELHGHGPTLLLIPGGAGDAGLFAGMTDRLAEKYTVVSFDPRGFTRSPRDDASAGQSPQEWADDAAHLIDAVGDTGPAFVLGTSSGAIAAVHLLARHPDRVRAVVAHEPPLLRALSDPEPSVALFTDVRDTFRRAGAGAAMARLAEGLGPDAKGDRDTADPEPAALPAGIQAMAARMQANTPVFLDDVLVPFATSWPEVETLASNAARLVLAAGADSRKQEPLYEPARRLSRRLGAEFAEFPGGHVGAVEQPGPFADRLLDVLSGR